MNTLIHNEKTSLTGSLQLKKLSDWALEISSGLLSMTLDGFLISLIFNFIFDHYLQMFCLNCYKYVLVSFACVLSYVVIQI